MQWKRDRSKRESVLYQEKYALDILDRFGMTESKLVKTPAIKEVEDQDEKFNDIELYQQCVGSLIYLNTCTRPDLSIAVSLLARKMSNPLSRDWTAAKRVLRYIRGTSAFGIKYSAGNGDSLIGYADADWAGDTKTRKSTSGYVFLLAKGPVSWATKKQTAVSLSTAEAENVSGSLATQELIWLKRLVSEVKGGNEIPTLMQDNQGAIAMSKNPVKHTRTKHIDIKYHFIREKLLNNEFKVQYCPTNEMIADIMTKPLGTQLFEKFRGMMNMVNSHPDKVIDKEQEGVLFIRDETNVPRKTFTEGFQNGLLEDCSSSVEGDMKV